MAHEDEARTPDEVVADNLKDYRVLGRLTQDEVAERMRRIVGNRWWRATVSEVERGHRNVSAGELWSLAVVLGVTIGDLLDPAGPGGRRYGGLRLEVEHPDHSLDWWDVHPSDAHALAWSRARVQWGEDGPGDVIYEGEAER